jgi:ABC-2 type transport system permease protein
MSRSMPLHPYLAVFKTRYLLLLQYRAAAIAGIVTQIFFGLVRSMILEGFYAASSAPQPMPLAQAITYVWLGQAFLLLVPWTTDGELKRMIQSGNVAYELVRPVDLYGVWFFRSVALRIAPTTLRAIPLLILAWSVFGMQLPASPAATLAWLASTACAFFLAGAFTTLITISFMWTIGGEGTARLLPSFAFFFSGMVIPLPLFPDWAQGVISFLPFRGLIDGPFRLYSGSIPAYCAWRVIGHQLLWTAAFILLGRHLLKRGLKRLVVQGG